MSTEEHTQELPNGQLRGSAFPRPPAEQRSAPPPPPRVRRDSRAEGGRGEPSVRVDYAAHLETANRQLMADRERAAERLAAMDTRLRELEDRDARHENRLLRVQVGALVCGFFMSQIAVVSAFVIGYRVFMAISGG